MQSLFLLHPGQPDFPQESSSCPDNSDLPLGTLGRLQAVMLSHCLQEWQPLTVFHDGTRIARETAERLGTAAGRSVLRELNPAAEDSSSSFHGLQQFLFALKRMAHGVDGNLALVCHAGIHHLVISGLIQHDRNIPSDLSQPYGCINHLIWDGEVLSAKRIGFLPSPPLDSSLCVDLLKAAETPDAVQSHCLAVARKAVALSRGLEDRLDTNALLASALLHDIARTKKDHAAVGAEWICALGYQKVSDIIACHHDLSPSDERILSEKTLLYLADKYMYGQQEVSLEERFSRSAARLTSDEARAAHQNRQAQAQRVEKLVTGQRGTASVPYIP